MSYHQLGMRTRVMKHVYYIFCALSYPVLGSHVFFLGCVAAILERPWVVTVAEFPWKFLYRSWQLQILQYF